MIPLQKQAREHEFWLKMVADFVKTKIGLSTLWGGTT